MRSKKAKNSYINYYHVHINTDAFEEYTTKSVVLLEKAYKILWYPSKMTQLLGFQIYTVDRDF